MIRATVLYLSALAAFAVDPSPAVGAAALLAIAVSGPMFTLAWEQRSPRMFAPGRVRPPVPRPGAPSSRGGAARREAAGPAESRTSNASPTLWPALGCSISTTACARGGPRGGAHPTGRPADRNREKDPAAPFSARVR